MQPPQDGSARSASAAAARVERLYEKCGSVLKQTLIQSFGVPPDVAEVMLHQAFGAAITRQLEDEEACVIAAVCRMGDTYRARKAFTPAIPPDASADELRTLRDVIFLRDAMNALPEPARVALSLRFEERRSYAEIAAELGVTTRYVKRLVLGALVKLRGHR